MDNTNFAIDCYFNKIKYDKNNHVFWVNDSDPYQGYDMITKHSRSYGYDYDAEIMMLSIELTNLCHEIARKKLAVLFRDFTVANNKYTFHPMYKIIDDKCPCEQQPTCDLAVSDCFKLDVEEKYLKIRALNRQFEEFGTLLNVREVLINIEDTYYSMADKAIIRDIDDYDWGEMESNMLVNVNGKHGFIRCIENKKMWWRSYE